ncbi:MAG: tRNA (guanosine(37)-N1)-methyltransferase TrmD [bacterium]|nr:tRNA (guanosine(37)-N1)-methyltransferase TrmD [bacterium]MDZ4285499.1 tRNA (guanosine(37)-N1)-methyltransferase TrmD [Candidatus Sungbacteria bacterium]
MRFDIITIFPGMFDSYINESIIKRAREKKLVDIYVHDLRAFTEDKHNKVDDRPFGGGPGMVLKAEPLLRAVDMILKKSKVKKSKVKVILFSAGGEQFDAKMSSNWVKKYDQIIMIAGRYEGMDERVLNVLQTTNYKLQTISIGPYVLTGGELPAMVVVDALSRHIPGVLGKEESLEETRYGVGMPAYTRPEVFEYKGKKYRVPEELLSGNHALIEEWRKKRGAKE